LYFSEIAPILKLVASRAPFEWRLY